MRRKEDVASRGEVVLEERRHAADRKDGDATRVIQAPHSNPEMISALAFIYVASSFTVGVGEPLQENSKCPAGRTLMTSGGR
jgi:hypothetical protein